MSPKNSHNSSEAKTNPKLKSSIVHKPFDTGTVNIFNPYRNKSSDRSNTPKLSLDLDASLEKLEEPKVEQSLESIEVAARHYWLNQLLNPWSVSAIAIIFFANLISAAAIWRNHRSTTETETVEFDSIVGSANLATEEFVPLDLSTLSVLKTAEDIVEEPRVTPIAPTLAPLNSAASALNPEYYYVLTEYMGDRSLALARQKVQQVSLVNLPQGVFIYLGAFKDKTQADEFVTQLKRENFSAQLYPFD